MDNKKKKEFTLNEEQEYEEEIQENAGHRDSGSDEFDDNPDVEDDDRVRGAGRQSLDDLAINREEGWGLEEGAGGLKSDIPDISAEEREPPEVPESA
jgi:hypothetical protein